jgi:hypothetical protein
MNMFLHYLYHDELPQGLDPSRVVEVAHVSCYYGTPRCGQGGRGERATYETRSKEKIKGARQAACGCVLFSGFRMGFLFSGVWGLRCSGTSYVSLRPIP